MVLTRAKHRAQKAAEEAAEEAERVAQLEARNAAFEREQEATARAKMEEERAKASEVFKNELGEKLFKMMTMKSGPCIKIYNFIDEEIREKTSLSKVEFVEFYNLLMRCHLTPDETQQVVEYIELETNTQFHLESGGKFKLPVDEYIKPITNALILLSTYANIDIAKACVLAYLKNNKHLSDEEVWQVFDHMREDDIAYTEDEKTALTSLIEKDAVTQKWQRRIKSSMEADRAELDQQLIDHPLTKQQINFVKDLEDVDQAGAKQIIARRLAEGIDCITPSSEAIEAFVRVHEVDSESDDEVDSESDDEEVPPPSPPKQSQMPKPSAPARASLGTPMKPPPLLSQIKANELDIQIHGFPTLNIRVIPRQRELMKQLIGRGLRHKCRNDVFIEDIRVTTMSQWLPRTPRSTKQTQQTPQPSDSAYERARRIQLGLPVDPLPKAEPATSSSPSASVIPSQSRLRTDLGLRKYAKLLDLGMPKEQVRLKMQAEGVDTSALNEGEDEQPPPPPPRPSGPATRSRVKKGEATLFTPGPTTSSGNGDLMAAIRKGRSLKKTPAPAPAASTGNPLLDAIKNPPKLKPVTKDSSPATTTPKPQTAQGNMMAAVMAQAAAMKERREQQAEQTSEAAPSPASPAEKEEDCENKCFEREVGKGGLMTPQRRNAITRDCKEECAQQDEEEGDDV
jgi:hypothetical protein